MRPEEFVAKQLIEVAIPGARMEYSEDQSRGQCDFALVVGEQRSPLEVTMSTRAARRRLHKSIEGRQGDGEYVARTLAKHDWCVVPSDRTDIRAVRDRIDRHLAAIETEGRDEFTVGRDAMSSAAVGALWRELWITDGYQLADDTHGCIVIGFPSDRAILTSAQVTAAVEYEAAKADNLRKLGGSDALERHLFIYVDWHGYPAQTVMHRGLVPPAFPEVSPVITHIWLATPAEQGAGHLLWRADRRAGWVSLGVLAVP